MILHRPAAPRRVLACVASASFVAALTSAAPLRSADDPAAEAAAAEAADDTALLQALVDRGGDVRLPAGPLRITAPILVDLQQHGRTSVSGGGVARVVMAGPGPAFRFVGTHDGTAAPRTVNDRVWEKENAPMLDGVEIVGDHPEADGVEAEGTMQLTLTRLVVRDAVHAVRLTGRNRNVTVSDCHLYENRGVGLFLDGVDLHQINVTGCHISYNPGGGVVAQGSAIRNLQIGACDIEANTGPAPVPGDAPGDAAEPGDSTDRSAANVWLDSTGAGATVAEVTIAGCTIQHGHAAARGANIRIQGGPDAVREGEQARSGLVTIADNLLSDVQTNVELTNVRGVTVTGNVMWQAFTANLVAEGCTRLVIANNMWDRNPTHHSGSNAGAKLGVRLERCTDCTLTGNHSAGAVFADAALILRNCSRVNLSGNTITDYGAGGLLLDGVSHGLVTGNLIRDDRPAANGVPLQTRDVRNVTVAGNLFGDDGAQSAPAQRPGRSQRPGR